MTNFAMFVVPSIVKRHSGFLIYSGGDDLLALLPVSTALRCARELRLAFSGDPQLNGGADSGYFLLADTTSKGTAGSMPITQRLVTSFLSVLLMYVSSCDRTNNRLPFSPALTFSASHLTGTTSS